MPGALEWRLVLCATAAVLAGCAGTQERLSQQGREAVALLRALPADARPRVVVAPIVDHTGEGPLSPLAQGLLDTGAEPTPWLAGAHDLLLTGLVNTGAFTVLERDELDELRAEALWADPAIEVALPGEGLEGAELLLAPALTSFEPAGGGALPLPIPISDDGDFALIWLRAGKASISMDLRLIDVQTGQVLKTTAVRGQARQFGADLDLIFLWDVGIVGLPGVLSVFNNTPVHAALLKMVAAAVDVLSRDLVPRLDPEADARTQALFRAVQTADPEVAEQTPK